jgi:DNA-binding CsgD family transcriptional regulator
MDEVSDAPTEDVAAAELNAAVERVDPTAFAPALELVARKLPVAAGVETATIRIRDSDGEGDLHLVATEGTASSDRRNPVFRTQSIPHARALFALRSRHSLALALGLSWLEGLWITHEGEPLGTITVASRTERRPTEAQAEIVRDVAARLGEKVHGVDRRRSTLESISQGVARASYTVPVNAPAGVVRLLRPRELTVLVLYSEGLSAREIADLFVISPHTVRTHIKNAYRRLGVHTREEASRLIQVDRVLDLV